MACIKRIELQDGNISYKIQVKAKNELTGKFETKCMAWRKPPEITERQAQRELQRVAFEFEDNFKKQMSGLLVMDNEVIFIDYAKKWAERIKITESLNYYIRSLDSIKKFEEYFGRIKLKSITPSMVQGFIDKLSNSPYQKRTAKLKIDINQYFASHFLQQNTFCKDSGVSRSILHYAKTGHTITMENAQRMCDTLKVKFDDIFDVVIAEQFYAKETISKHKRTLHTILANAKRERLIEHNFASKDYILPIRGTKKEVKILNENEAKALAVALTFEEKPQWKYSLLISLFMGIRRGELAGLQWEDIDFENKTMTIARSVQDIVHFGIQVKDPKTETSKRTISMPDKLVEYLKEYKIWWDQRKAYFGDRWKDAKMLFCNENGGPICPGLFRTWLQKILFREGLPVVTLHSLRHTNITLLLSAGVDMKTVSVRAGHARSSTTSDFYSHFLKNSDVVASNKINEIFG